MNKISGTLHPLLAKATQPIAQKDVGAQKEKASLDQASEQFEAMLALQMVQTMEKSLENGNMFGKGVAGDMYSGLTEWELARVLAKSTDFGIKNELLRQIGNREDTTNEVRSR